MMALWAVLAPLLVIVALLFALFALGEQLRELRDVPLPFKRARGVAPATPSSDIY